MKKAIKALVASSILLSSAASQAGAIGFNVGSFVNGGFGFENLSSGGITLDSIMVDFTTNNQGDTFFDTTASAPGTASSPWGVISAAGVVVNLPGNAATDGAQTATIGFTGFDPLETVRLSVDFDYLAFPDGTGGDIVGTTFKALFSNGATSTAILSASSLNIGGTNYSHSATGVPAPAGLALFGIGLAGLGWARRNKA